MLECWYVFAILQVLRFNITTYCDFCLLYNTTTWEKVNHTLLEICHEAYFQKLSIFVSQSRFSFPPLVFTHVCVCVCAGVWACVCVQTWGDHHAGTLRGGSPTVDGGHGWQRAGRLPRLPKVVQRSTLYVMRFAPLIAYWLILLFNLQHSPPGVRLQAHRIA